MIKVSVVIPVYNGEKYLEQCIRSALCQTLRELEIICVDDGSTDASAQIVRGLQAKDARIFLLQQENQGAGAARNLAMEKARGKYIAFLDADDFYIDKDALEIMFQTAETERLPVCGSLRKRIKGGVMEVEALFPGAVVGERLDYQDYQLDYHYQNFLFLKSHLTEHEICFPKYRRFQDPPFLVRALYTARRFILADTYLYCYRWSDMEPRFNAQKVNDLLCGLTDNLHFATEHNLHMLFQNTLCRLEEEYVDIICKNISSDDFLIWEQLIRANQIVCEYYGKSDYVVQPLCVLSFGICQNSYRKKILQLIEEQNEIALYGAGKYGKLFLKFLRNHGLHGKVRNFIVSDLRGNESRIEGVPVVAIGNCQKKWPVFVAVRAGVRREIERLLDKNGYTGYIVVREEFLHVIAAEEDESCIIATV